MSLQIFAPSRTLCRAPTGDACPPGDRISGSILGVRVAESTFVKRPALAMMPTKLRCSRFFDGMAGLITDYDGFILDQWGVLHDGVKPYPGAIECLQRLRAAGKYVVILSNSGRRNDYNMRLMAQLGFEQSLYDRFIGAGEDARSAIVERRSDFHRQLGSRCYAFTRDGDRSLLEGIGLTFAAHVEDADFLAAIGIDSPRRTILDYETELRIGVARGLPLVCANPDLVRVSPEGTVDAPGMLARRYEELGGRVARHGKPYPEIYASCLAALCKCRPERVIAVGDSIEHDILGAARAGLPSAFVVGGIHTDDLVGRWGDQPSKAAWTRFVANAEARPDFVVPAFVW